MDNELRVGVTVDATQAEAGMNRAASAVSDGAARIQQTFRSAAEATQALTAAQLEMKQVLEAVGGSINETNAAYGLYAEAAQRAAAAQEFLAATTNQVSEAAAVASASFDRNAYNMAYASGYAGSYALGLRGVGFMLGRIGATSEAIAPILQAIFPYAIAGLLAEQLVKLVAEFQKWYENTYALKQALADLIQVGEQLHDQQDSAQLQLIQQEAQHERLLGHTQAYIQLLRQMGSLEPMSVRIKLSHDDLDNLQRAGLHVRSLLNELNRGHHVEDFVPLAGPVAASIKQVQDFITTARRTIARDTAAAGMFGGSQVDFVLRGQVSAAQQLLGDLDAAQKLIATKSTAAALGTSNRVLEAEQEAEKKKKKSKSDADQFFRFVPGSPGPEQETWAQWRAELKRDAEAIQKTTDNIKAAKQSMSDSLYELTSQYRAPRGLTPGGDLGFNLAALNPTVAAPGKAPLDMKALAQESDKFFAGFNRGMDQAIQGVVMGTQTMSQAWRRMFADMVVSQMEALAQLVLKFIEHQAAIIAITTFGISTRTAMEDAANTHSRESDAKKGATSVWSSVLKALPFPLNVIVAPIAAGAEFAAMMAFEKGGVVPSTGPALLHQHEMVLPAPIAQHVMETAGSGAGSRTITVNNHVSALDGADAHSVLVRNSNAVAAGVQREMRRRGLV